MASADVDITARPYDQDPSAPEPHGPLHGASAAAPTRDDLDDLFNYDAQIDDVFQDTEENGARVQSRRDEADDLGIDEEIKIKKARKPIAKLDEERLLSQNGIPKLRRISKDRLRFRGKGHEFSDVQRLLNTYQLWLDDLFPKAKFGDGLAIIEKLGHKKRLKIMRQEWINEDKPKPEVHDISDTDADFVDNDADRGTVAPNEATGTGNEGSAADDNTRGDLDMDVDGLDDDALYGRPDEPSVSKDGQGQGDAQMNETVREDEPEEDELDQLLAEDAAKAGSQQRPALQSTGGDWGEFADDEEAMAGMW